MKELDRRVEGFENTLVCRIEVRKGNDIPVIEKHAVAPLALRRLHDPSQPQPRQSLLPGMEIELRIDVLDFIEVPEYIQGIDPGEPCVRVSGGDRPGFKKTGVGHELEDRIPG